MKTKKYLLGGEIDPPKKTIPNEGGWTGPNRAKVSPDAKGELTSKEALELLTRKELVAALAKRGVNGPDVTDSPYNKLVSMGKTAQVYQPARVAAVAAWKKKYGQAAQ